MVGQAEIVVGAEVDDLAAGDADGRALRPLELALALVEALGLEVVELALQLVAETLIAHGVLLPSSIGVQPGIRNAKLARPTRRRFRFAARRRTK